MNNSASENSEPGDQSRAGFFFALFAYTFWGFMVLYWKETSHINPLEIMAHRTLWALPFAGIVLLLLGRTSDILPALRSPRKVMILFLTAVLVAANWGLFVWAIAADRTLETALAYYINPLLTIAMGALLLGDRFHRLQLVAIGLAFLAVTILTWMTGELPWVSLVLAMTFALYGLLRKTVDVGPTQGFFVEVLLMSGFAAAYIGWLLATGEGNFLQGSLRDDVLLIFAGPATAIPLILYANGAKRLRLSTLGIMQYIAPSLIFLIGIFVFLEPISLAQMLAFALIWAALALYSWSLFQAR